MQNKTTKKLSMEKLYPIMLDEFKNGHEFRMITHGTSMKPLIGDGCDTVILKKVTGKLKKYDIPLYRRSNGGFVLHRIVGFDENGYIMCGDNQTALEHGITDNDIVAVADGVIKNGRLCKLSGIRYRLYLVIITLLRPARRMYIKCRRR